MNDLIAIIPSAWIPQNQLFPGIYDPMIPINGKPTIDYILWNLYKLWIKSAIVLLNENDNKSYEYLLFRKSNIELIIKKVNTKSLWETICTIKKIIIDKKILIHLWDWIYTWNFDFSNDNILVQNKKVLNPEKWCFIDKEKKFINAPSFFSEDFRLVIWLYFIKNANEFLELLLKNSFYDSLTKYSYNNILTFQEITDWYYDLWHLDEFYKSKIDFLRVRDFNFLEYDKFKWVITKNSLNSKKLEQEINWYKNIPNELKIFTPRLINYNLWNKASYSLEFYWYTSLADIFLYSNYSQWILWNILDKIFDYIDYVKKNYNNKNFSNENIVDIYLNKTFSRLDKLLKIKELEEIYNKEYLIINWTKYKNISFFIYKERIQYIINKYILKEEDFSIIHWDLCFSNILFDVHNWLFKLIDPRWNFWENWIWGDIKYDLAKLRHSVHWRYENIISDLFNLEISDDGNNFSFEYFNWKNNLIIDFFDKKIKEIWYDLDLIKFIEWLLYLTMIPLHKDSLERQKVMYLTATILFNETEKLWK